jgi:hypothetical protein
MFTPQISFSLEDQIGDNWCWLAVAVSTDRHFHLGSILKQCDLATQLIPGASGCCTNNGSVPRKCDQPGALDDALSAVNELAPGANPSAGALLFPQVQAEIDNGRPVGIRIGWDGDPQFNGHFIIVTGYQVLKTKNKLYVQDPLWGDGLYSYQQVATNYLSNDGVWTHTYLVKG